MPRKNRKKLTKLTNRKKLIITVAVLAICLFIIHRFNFLTKSEFGEVTSINFVESGTENSKNASLEFFTEEDGKKFIILPEKVDGYFVEKFVIAEDNPILEYNSIVFEEKENNKNQEQNAVDSNIISNTTIDSSTNNIDTNTIANINTNTTVENEIQENQNSSVVEEKNEISNTVVSNDEETESITTNEDEDDTVSETGEETEENISEADLEENEILTNRVNVDSLQKVSAENKTVENTLTNEVTNNVVSNIVEEKVTNNVISNVVKENETNDVEENTNEISNSVSNEVVKNDEKEENEEQSNTIIDNSTDNEDSLIENEDSKLEGENLEIKNALFTDYKPGDKIYLDDEMIDKNTAKLEVVYQSKEIEDVILYNRELVEGAIKIVGYIPKDYSINAKLNEPKEYADRVSELKEFENAKALIGYDIKIVDSEGNEYQPIEYGESLVLTIENPQYLQEELENNSVEVIHFKETATEEILEKIVVIEKTDISVKFIVDEFSEYAVFAYMPVTNDIVTINDYQDDKNYYLGRNYTTEMDGEKQDLYNDSNLAKVNIHYFSYDYDKNIYGSYDVSTTETWAFKNTTDGGNYVGYNISITITAASGKLIDKTKPWIMTFDVPNDEFLAARTKTANGSKLKAVVQDETTVTITGDNLSNWTENSAYEKYTLNLVLAFERHTRIAVVEPNSDEEITLPGLVDSTTGEIIIPDPYVDPETGETVYPEPTVRKDATTGEIIEIETGEVIARVINKVIYFNFNQLNNLEVIGYEKLLIGYVSNASTERQVLFSYTKCVPIENGKVTIEAIDNPYMDRPALHGFDGWTTHESNHTIKLNANNKVQSVTVPVDSNKEATIYLYANWKKANIVFVNGNTGINSNSGKALAAPVKTFAQAETILANTSNYKTATNASNRELNIVVFTGGIIRGDATDGVYALNKANKAFTLTSLYDGVDYRQKNTVVYYSRNLTMNCDAQFDFVNLQEGTSTSGSYVFNNTGYKYVQGNGNHNYYLCANTYNVRFGRGMNPICRDGSASNDCTLTQLQGGPTGAAKLPEHRLVVESGKYANLLAGAGSNNTTSYTASDVLVAGCDYDRVKGVNTNLQVYHRTCAGTAKSKPKGYNGKNGTIMIIKSGQLGMSSFNGGSSYPNFSGIYVGALGSGNKTTEYSQKELIVEGGEIANILGGFGLSAYSSTTGRAEIYMKNGLAHCVFAGSGVDTCYGDRKIQITGGRVDYSVCGGSNGYNSSSSSSNGKLHGSTLMYIGGNAQIGVSSNSSTKFNLNAGNVFGAGNGTTNTTYNATSGSVRWSHVIIDGNAVINNSVYGGGNHGIVGSSGAGNPTTEKADATNVVEIEILGGTIKGSVYAGANQNAINGSAKVTVKGGHIQGALYGGSNTKGRLDGASILNIEGGTIGKSGTISDVVFGGGQGSPTEVSQRTEVNINDNSDNLYLYGNVYGGSALGEVGGSTKVNVTDNPSKANTVSITGDIYGGGKGNSSYAAKTGFDVTVNVDGGNFAGTNVFGGCNLNGTISRNVLVNIGQTKLTRVNYVYGSGNQAQMTTATKSVYVNLYSNANVVKAFNGGNKAGIAGTTAQTKRYIKAIGATVGDLYGGSNESGNLVDTNVYTSNNANIINVYGGGYGTNAKITGNTYVDISGSNIQENVHGGGDAGSVASNTEVFIDNSEIGASVYAGGKGTTASVGKNTNLEVTGSTIHESVYGGGNNGPVTQNTDINVIDTYVEEAVYAGGKGETAIVSGNTGGTVDSSIIEQSVYGGGNAGKVVGGSNIDVSNNALIKTSVYGGGKAADIGTTSVNVEDSEVIYNVYGGGEEGRVITVTNPSTSVTMKNALVKNVFGGGKGQAAVVSGSTSVEISSSNIQKQEENQGNVYGGGDLGAVNKNTLVNVLDNTIVDACVYGGGNAADVKGSTSVAVDTSNVLENVYGGGNAGDITSTGTSTAVSVLSSTIEKSVFGGGNKGEVTGNTSVMVSGITNDDGTINNSIIKENIYGGGNEANVNGTSVNVTKQTSAINVYGGGNLGEVEEDIDVIIDNALIENNVYGGGAGSEVLTDGSKGRVSGDINLTVRNESTIYNRVFGAGQGVTAEVLGNTNVNFIENSSTLDDVYGGGDNGPVNGSTSLIISSGIVGGSAYGAGNGITALVREKSYVGVDGESIIFRSVFGGGNAAETGEKYIDSTGKETGDALTIVDIAGADIYENVYGGANSSVIYGSTVTNIGLEAINDYYGDAEKPKEFVKGKVEIAGTIFGGGEQMDPTKPFNYDTISVTETILINIDGDGYDTNSDDPNTFNFYQSVFGSGNASSANTNGNINIRNFGTREKPKRITSLQRATDVRIDNSSILLNGTTDSTSAHPEGLFALNRITHLILKNDSTLFLVNGANLLAHYSSMVGEDDDEEYAVATIIDTVIGENGREYEVINGNVYDNMGNIEYYVSNGSIYEPNRIGIGEDIEVTKVASYKNATTIDRNTDNRIYMYSGRNLNISDDEEVTSKYGDVKGMTFFGIFKSDGGEGSGDENSVYMGMYDTKYNPEEGIRWEQRDFNRSYVLGLHNKNPEQDITKDGFYTVYERLGIELKDDDILSEGNYQDFEPSAYTSYITPTPKDDVYYMWYAGPDDEVFYYNFTLTASKHSTFGTKELSLLGISYENAVLTLTSVDGSLANGVGLYDKNTIPNINTDQDAANNNFGLTMKTSTSGWSMTGSTDFYVTAITDDNPSSATSYSGTSKYTIENLKTTPSFMFFLYHSNNITEPKELGTFQINMNLSYWKDSLNRGSARIIIDAILFSEVYNDSGYNGAISPGSNYDLFANTVTNVTTKSSFSTYFELAQSEFSQIENIQNYYEDSYRVITTEYAFPTGTTITMIDRWDKNNPKYYYYTVSAEDYSSGKIEYKLADFKVIGSLEEKYDEKTIRENYYIDENGLDYQYENFIFITNFENTEFPELPEGETTITKDKHFRMYLKAIVDGREEILFGLLDDQIDSIVYGIYDTESTIDVDAEVSKSRVFLGNPVSLKVNTIYDVKKGEQSVTIYDTRYFDKKLGIKLTFYEKIPATGEYKVVSGADLLGTYFELNGEKYYPRADGTTRIKIAELVSNASSTIKIGTENSALKTAEYQIKVESFGSADGIYYGVESSATDWVGLEIINDVYGLNSRIPEEQVIIDKTTGYTLDASTGKINEAGHNELNFDIEYLSGVNNPYITVSLYRRDYDESMKNPYQNTYTKVDFAEYVSNELEVPLEINQEYTEEDQEFIDSIKQFEYEYKAIDTETIRSIVTEDTISVTMNCDFELKEALKSGTYKVVFSLYDISDEVVYKEVKNENGEVISRVPFNIKEYMYIGDTFSYIIIK